MKRLLALLLALLLPGCAAAETFGFSLVLDVNEEQFASRVKQSVADTLLVDGMDLDVLTAAVARTLNGLQVEAAVQQDAVSVIMRLAKGELLNVTVYTTQDGMYVTSPMLDGYTLKHVTDVEKAAAEELAQIDWLPVFSGMTSELGKWISAREPIVTYGSFEGDAYAGGVKCMTWMVSDADIAALVSALTSPEFKLAMAEILAAFGLSPDALNALDAISDQVSEADRYRYLFRIVTDKLDEFVGASLTVMEDNAQIATISFGNANERVNLVVGVGLNEQNYWWDFSGVMIKEENCCYLSGTTHEWLAVKDESFSYVCKTNTPLTSYQLRGTMTNTAEQLLWDGRIAEGDGGMNASVVSFSGSYSQDTCALEYAINFGQGVQTALGIHARFGQVEAIPTMDSTLKHCSVTSAEDAVLYEELISKWTASLMARLIKLLPMDLIMMINQVTLPE